MPLEAIAFKNANFKYETPMFKHGAIVYSSVVQINKSSVMMYSKKYCILKFNYNLTWFIT